MERIDQLDQQVRNLSLAVRLGLTVVIAAFAFQCCVVLARAPHFGEIFADLFEGAALPALTQFFLSFSLPITIGVVVLSVVSIVALFALPKQIWSIPLGVLVAIITVATSQLAAFSFQMPLLRIISMMSA